MQGLKKRVRMGRYTTYGIGGSAAYYVSITNKKQLIEALNFANARGLPYFVLGKGSNCLFDDRGYSGLVIHNCINFYEREGAMFTVGAGYAFPMLGVRTAKLGYHGLEFAVTIPGSVGGAVVMNAGAHGQETQAVLQRVQYLTERGEIRSQAREELEFGYRTSSFQKKKYIITAATFSLTRSPTAHELQRTFLTHRMTTQPLKSSSCGCVFRNPDKGRSAGQLIDACGLKGRRWGDITISEKHANFFLNNGKGTAQDILNLIQDVQEIVYKKTNIHLETELQWVSDNGRTL